MSRMFGHVNTHVLVHQGAPQEPRTPEQTTRPIALHTPPKLELRANQRICEPEDLRAGMEQEEALLVVAKPTAVHAPLTQNQPQQQSVI